MFFIFFLFLALCVVAFFRYQKYHRANKLYHQAKILEKQNNDNPSRIAEFKKALAIYLQCNKLVDSSRYKKAITRCQTKIEDCQNYEYWIIAGRKQAGENYFKTALHSFTKAEKLFVTAEITNEINKCRRDIQRENQYEEVLKLAKQIAREGDFRAAIDLLAPAVENFRRQDGTELLTKIELVIKSRNLYQLGLIAENEGQTSKAIANYQQALDLIPEYADCKLRLAIIAVESEPQQAIDYLTGIKLPQANYIRGFAYIQLSKWQEAEREWNSIENSDVKDRQNAIKDLLERERITTLLKIERSVDLQQLETAKSISVYFLEKYANNLIVRHNLEQHIKPAIERQIWQEKNWQEIAEKTENIWLQKQDIESLHNWAIASYYLAQVNPDKLTNFIIAWFTALANIKLDPSLKNVPWLGSHSIDLETVSDRLKQIVENTVNDVKNNHLESHLMLKDLYRRDMMMLTLSQQNNYGIKTGTKLVILPNCYQKFQQYFPLVRLPEKLWGALYTDWGVAVAACHVGDIARAIKIKPNKAAISKAESFARALVFYHEGCHYLQNLCWREAIKSLQEAKSEIIVQPDWCKEIDRLSEIQRQYIKEFQEHLEFSRSWYLLIGSQAAKAYYVEYESMQIGLSVDDREIDFQQALIKLRELQNIASNNSVNSNIIETLEVNLELEKINHLWQQSNYEAAIQLALGSQYEKVRFAVAEVCLEIVLEILHSGNLTPESIQSIQKITHWAYELCPREPLFQTTYSQLKQLGLHR